MKKEALPEMDKFYPISFIEISVDGKGGRVQVCDYVKAKTKQLKEFGYGSLTEEQTLKSLWVAVNTEKPTDVIAAFIKSDLVKEK